MNHQIKVFIFSFIIILVMMTALAFTAYFFNHNADAYANQVISAQFERLNQSLKLSTSIHQRRYLLHYLLHESDEEARKTGLQEYDRLQKIYEESKQQMLSIVDARERRYLLEIDRINQDIADSLQLVLIQQNALDSAYRRAALAKEILPQIDQQLGQLGQLLMSQQEGINVALEQVGTSARANRLRFAFYAILSLLLSSIVAVVTVVYGQRLNRQIEELTDYLEERIHERTESLLDTQQELLEDNNELVRLASTDDLTGLLNRNRISDIILKEFSRFKRHNQFFGIIMLDIDHFKLINDTHGHDVGDVILTQFADTLQKTVRNSDHVARWGGEEFLVCCTTIRPGDLFAIAENLRKAIANTDFSVIGQLTVSLGCSVIHPDETARETIKRADVALYEAKNNGRNQSVISAMDS